ncbi:MAG: hypothetical protein K2F78_00115 [Muribaculaceae bacterium]|nr:hypothetical protein [Muribaculaceae bacterium]
MTLIEAIRLRRSVRDYSGTVLTGTQRAAMLQAIHSATAPFGPAPHIALRTFDAPDAPQAHGLRYAISAKLNPKFSPNN